MHIGFYSPVWRPGTAPNGIVTYVRIVRDELRRRGHRVTVFSGRCETSASDGIVQVADDRRTAAWGALRRRLGVAADAPYDFGKTIADAVTRFHAREPLDVFEMEESFGWCKAVATRLRAPTVVKLHGPAFLSLIDGADAETPDRLERIEREGDALRAVRAVISPSPSTLAATAGRYALAREALSSIPNPVESVGGSLVWRAGSADAEQILFVGRFDFRKGGDAMLEAFERIAAARPAACLTFVGPDVGLRLLSGRLEHFGEYLRAHLTPEAAARVRFLGSQPAHEIARLRTKAAVTVAATRWESFGYVVAEAMNQGCPVVGFDVPGVNELIEHGRSGLLAPLDDIETFTRHICRVLDDRALAAALGARARESVAATCGAEGVVGRMLDVYRKLTEADSTKRRP